MNRQNREAHAARMRLDRSTERMKLIQRIQDPVKKKAKLEQFWKSMQADIQATRFRTNLETSSAK